MNDRIILMIEEWKKIGYFKGDTKKYIYCNGNMDRIGMDHRVPPIISFRFFTLFLRILNDLFFFLDVCLFASMFVCLSASMFF